MQICIRKMGCCDADHTQFTHIQNQLNHGQVIQVTDPETLCLSLDWEPHSSNPRIITSLSTGSLSLLSPTSTGTFGISSEWKAHEYESWITSWDHWSRDLVWSGGDDCRLKSWDIRTLDSSDFDPTPTPLSINKNFDGGVTTISSSPHTPHLLAVGSYDSNLRLFDTRSMKVPLRTIPVGGGVWRTKWNPSKERKGELVLACMHGGFRTIKLDDEFLAGGEIVGGWAQESVAPLGDEKSGVDKGQGWETTAVFDKHESIAYGVDWSRAATDEHGRGVIASCSFYDHSMMLWHA